LTVSNDVLSETLELVKKFTLRHCLALPEDCAMRIVTTFKLAIATLVAIVSA
jgi:hypothetical protein